MSRFIKPDDYEIEVGATEALRLRVSVATLVRVLFDHPENGETMLALERTATLREIDGKPEIIVRAKPFGGAVRLINPQALKRLVGDFHFDSEQSRQEKDFRILIYPTSWETVMDICWQHLNGMEKSVLDPSPERELAEEFEDSLHVRLNPGQYELRSSGIILEDQPIDTDNVRAEGFPTVRVYYLFEAQIEAHEIVTKILDNHKRYTDKDLEEMALKDARRGGKGRANAVLALKLDDLKDVYRSDSVDRSGSPIKVGLHQLEGNVWAILE